MTSRQDVLIGLDIGTTKVCAVAFGVPNGRLLAVVDAPNNTNLKGEPDASEQDADRLAALATKLLRRLTACPAMTASRPLALGVTGQMHGVVLVGRTGKTLTPLINWQDKRGQRSCRSTGRTYAGELVHRLGRKSVEYSGCQAATGYGGVTLLRLAEEKALPANVVALTIHDMVVRRLCGRAVTDPSNASSWGIFDVKHGDRWLPNAVKALRVSKAILPEVMPTGSQAGTLLPELARATGLPAGLPVAVALGDNQASFIGSVLRLTDTLLMNLGTGGQMSIPVQRFVRVYGLDTRPLIKGRWLLVGASLCGGRAYQVLEHFFRRVGQDVLGLKKVPPLYEVMNRLASAAPADCGGIQARTLFEGSRLDAMDQGMFGGLTSKNMTPANLSRAVIGGMIQELVAFYELTRSAGARVSLLAGAGNAVRSNPVVRSELESRLNIALHLPPYQEEAAIGAALAGGMAAGIFKDWSEAGRTLFASVSAG